MPFSGAPDSEGYSYFVTQLKNGTMTRAQVGLAILQSSEFQNLVNTHNHVTVSLLYFDMLHRQPDAGGYAGWLDSLNAGTTGTNVVNAFLNSREYAGRFQ